jgi:hypothetical protein
MLILARLQQLKHLLNSSRPRLFVAWALRLGVCYALLSVLGAPQARAVLGEAQRVITSAPKLCLHTRLTDEVYEWKIQHSLELIRQMGAPHIVEFFPWAYYEPAPDRYDWSRPDLIMRHIRNQGLKVYARMGFVPTWARPDPSQQATSFNSLPPDSYDDFAEFVALFAERYADVLAGVIIWNEPNLAFEWGYQPPDPRTYFELLAVVAPAIRATAPKVLILGGALAPTLEPVGSPHGMNDLVYLEELLALGASQYMDALAVHTYGFDIPADDAPAPMKLNFRRVELLHDILRRTSDMPIIITEFGWNDDPRWTRAVSPAQRIQYTLDSLHLGETWDWLEAQCLWAFRFPTPVFAYPDNYTLATTIFQLKPIYYALQDYAQGRESAGLPWLAPPR